MYSLPTTAISSLSDCKPRSLAELTLTLFHFLEQMAQFILDIIRPQNAEDPPPFLNQTEFYTKEFWHAHLNYACTQLSASQRGPERLVGNQLCHWTSNTADVCMKVTHFIFVPPVLGACILSHHPTQGTTPSTRWLPKLKVLPFASPNLLTSLSPPS